MGKILLHVIDYIYTINYIITKIKTSIIYLTLFYNYLFTTYGYLDNSCVSSNRWMYDNHETYTVNYNNEIINKKQLSNMFFNKT